MKFSIGKTFLLGLGFLGLSELKPNFLKIILTKL